MKRECLWATAGWAVSYGRRRRQDWLRDRAYPMIKGSAEFYRHFPNFKKGEDGKYHIHHINNRESDWGGSDSPYEVSSMHTIFPLAMRASEIIAVDEDLRPIWREIKENLVPIPERGRRRGSGAYGDKQAEALNGHLLKFSTRKGEHIVLV